MDAAPGGSVATMLRQSGSAAGPPSPTAAGGDADGAPPRLPGLRRSGELAPSVGKAVGDEVAGTSCRAIHPRTQNKIYWDGYILVLVLYTVTLELYFMTMTDGSAASLSAQQPAPPPQQLTARCRYVDGVNATMDPIDWWVDLSYWVDIALNFVTGYDEDGRGHRYVMRPSKSAARYLRSWFLIDLVSTFPYAHFDATKDSLLSLLRLLRGTRFLRVMNKSGNSREIFDAAVARFGIRAAKIDIMRFVAGIFLCIHVLACLFHLLGLLQLHGRVPWLSESQWGEDKAENWLLQYNIADAADGVVDAKGEAVAPVSRPTKYLWSLYWAVTTVTTIGYGDITPVSNIEILAVCCAELVGMYLFVYTVNNVSDLLRGLNAKQHNFQDKLDQIQQYMETRDIPMELQQRVLQYLNFINSPKCLTEPDEDELLLPLTQTLREELRMASYVPWLTRNKVLSDLLQNTGGQFGQLPDGSSEYLGGSDLEGLVDKIALQLRSLTAAPYDIVISGADEAKDMEVFILLTGKVQLYGSNVGSAAGTATNSLVVRTIQHSDERALFGTHELFEAGTPPPEWCVEAATFCDLAYLDRSILKQAIQDEEDLGVCVPRPPSFSPPPRLLLLRRPCCGCPA